MRFAFCIAACLAANVSHSATVSVGSFEIDTLLFADDVQVIAGAAPTAPRVIGTDFADSVGVTQDATIEVIFLNNTVVNGAGFDLLLFETGNPEVPSVSLTANGTALQGTLVERDTARILTPEAINIWGFDFDDFSLAVGPEIGSIFLRGTAENTPEIQAVAAVNGAPISPVPLPSGLALMGTAVGLSVAMKRRRTRAAQTRVPERKIPLFHNRAPQSEPTSA